MSLVKCTGWPFGDLDPRSRLWHQLAKICLSARSSENHSLDYHQTWQRHCTSHGYYLIRIWRSFVGNSYFGKYSLKISDVIFQGQTLFWPYLRNGCSDWWETKNEVPRFDTGYNMWHWPLTSLMTLTLDVSMSDFETALSLELLVWLMWNENEVI